MKRDNLILWLILILAFGLRLWGNTFGFPCFLHPDEHRVTLPALNISEKGQWNPENFIYPTGFIYLLFFGFKLFAFFDPSFYDYYAVLIILHWLGRFYSAFLGAGSVWLIYTLGKKAYGSSAGIVAALFLSLNLIHIRHSHYATTDIMNLFFVLLSISSIFNSRLPLAGLFGGIATGVKYNAWPIIFPLLLVSKKRFVHAFFFYVLGFFITTPFAFIDPRHFFANFIEILITPRSYWLGITHPSPIYYFYGFRPIAGVGAIFILSLMGLVFRLKKWSWYDTILMSFFLPYIILISLTAIKLDRYILTAIIIFLLWASIALDKIAIILGRRYGGAYLVLSILAVSLSLHPLLKAIRYDQRLEGKDTRLIALEWIKNNIPSSSHLALFSHHSWANPTVKSSDYEITRIPLVYKNRDRDREIFKLRLARCKVIAPVIKKVFGKEFCPEIFQQRIDRLVPLEDFELLPLRYFKERGVEYIILTGFLKDDLLDKATAEYFSKLSSSSHSFFGELEREAELVYSLSPVKEFGRDCALSPSIEIYKLKTNSIMVK